MTKLRGSVRRRLLYARNHRAKGVFAAIARVTHPANTGPLEVLAGSAQHRHREAALAILPQPRSADANTVWIKGSFQMFCFA